jgi:hypothetical protein
MEKHIHKPNVDTVAGTMHSDTFKLMNAIQKVRKDLAAAEEDHIEKQQIKFPCVSFYTDCTHDLSEVTEARSIILL